MRRSLLIVATALSLLIAWGWNAFQRKLTADNIIAVQPGMTMEEVLALLGDPERQEVSRDVRFFCHCNEEQICREPERTTWTYTRKPVMRVLPFPMLWVHFNSRGHVNEVYAKKYFALGMDSKGIYSVKLDPCDTTDRTVDDRYGRLFDGAEAIQRLHEIF